MSADVSMQGLKTTIAEKLNQTRCRESLNSSGTVSRKTSTASEYTPEHTYILNSRAQFDDQTNVSYALDNSCVTVTEQQSIKKVDDPKEIDVNYIEEATPRPDVIVADTIDNPDLLKIELNNSLKQKDVKFLPGQKVNIVNFVMSVDKQDAPIAVPEDIKADIVATSDPVESKERIIPIQVEETKDEEKVSNVQEQKTEDKPPMDNIRVPQRKISRFLVSPVLSGQLDLPKDKEFGSDTQSECSENPLDTVSAIPQDIKRQEPLRKISAPLESTRTNLEMEKPEQKMSVCSLQEAAITKEESATVCGPELINTLEQLKISLDNLKHSNHPVHKKETSESDMKKLSTVEVSFTKIKQSIQILKT